MSALDSILFGDGKPAEPCGVIMVSPTFAAVYKAKREFYGRDWRRIKREVRKAILRARPHEITGISREPSPFWRTHA